MGVIAAQGTVAEARDEGIVAAARRLEKPAADRLEHRGQRIQPFLDAGEPSQRPVEVDDVAGLARGDDEGVHQLERLPRHVEEPIAEKMKIIGPGRLLQLTKRCAERVGAGRELVRQTVGDRRMEVALHPHDPLQRLQERGEQRDDRVDQATIRSAFAFTLALRVASL